jgi:hypothetical protein
VHIAKKKKFIIIFLSFFFFSLPLNEFSLFSLSLSLSEFNLLKSCLLLLSPSPSSLSLSYNELSLPGLDVEFGDLARNRGWVWVDPIGGKTRSGEI